MNKLECRKGENIKYIFFATASFFITTICSMCSFLYPLHNRVDQNAFFTIGREMLAGKDVYTDLFDHKGTITYLMHEIAAVFSQESMIGMYFFELIFMFIYLIFLYKIANLYMNQTKSVLISVITATITTTTQCFLRGNNCEEFGYVLITVSLYYMLREKEQDDIVYLLNGIFTAFMLWSKFTLIGFWVGWALVSYIPLLFGKEFKKFFRYVLMFILGFAVITVPLFIYHLIRGNTYDFLYTYIYCNVVLYAKEITMFDRIKQILWTIGKNFSQNHIWAIVTFIGLAGFFRNNKYVHTFKKRISVLISFATCYIVNYWGGVWYDYYLLILVPFAVFGVIYIVDAILYFSRLNSIYEKYKSVVAASVLCLCLAGVVFFSNTFPYLGKKAEEYPQIKIANKIEEICEEKGIENPTMLNYAFIDGGFYLASDISPINKYFFRPNISQEALPELYEQQMSIVANREVDFLVTRTWKSRKLSQHIDQEEVDLIESNYIPVMSADEIYDFYKFTLWIKIEE